MNKFFKGTIFSTVLLLACSGAALADGTAFTPLDFDDTSYGITSSTSTDSQESQQIVGNDSLENAILQLDTAQIDVRNQLLDCKTKFSEIDSQYKNIKQERTDVNKQIKDIEKKIKDIDKTKEKIRKNMD